MDTLIKTHQVSVFAKTETSKVNSTSEFWEKVEFCRFGIMPMLLVIIGCMGGFAAGFGAQADVFKLATIAFPTIIALAFMLAVAPMRIIISLSAFALFLDLLVLIF